MVPRSLGKRYVPIHIYTIAFPGVVKRGVSGWYTLVFASYPAFRALSCAGRDCSHSIKDGWRVRFHTRRANSWSLHGWGKPSGWHGCHLPHHRCCDRIHWACQKWHSGRVWNKHHVRWLPAFGGIRPKSCLRGKCPPTPTKITTSASLTVQGEVRHWIRLTAHLGECAEHPSIPMLALLVVDHIWCVHECWCF